VHVARWGNAAAGGKPGGSVPCPDRGAAREFSADVQHRPGAAIEDDHGLGLKGRWSILERNPGRTLPTGYTRGRAGNAAAGVERGLPARGGVHVELADDSGDAGAQSRPRGPVPTSHVVRRGSAGGGEAAADAKCGPPTCSIVEDLECGDLAVDA